MKIKFADDRLTKLIFKVMVYMKISFSHNQRKQMIFMTPSIQQALRLIHPGMIVSLGGGRHMQALADALAQTPIPGIQLTSPSELTLAYCQQRNLPLAAVPTRIDMAFDGCDSADTNLNLLKSNGGIHTLEKNNAEMAAAYIILAPAERVTAQLAATVPLCLEVVPPCVSQVLRTAAQLGLRAKQRLADNYAGYVRTSLGNALIDCFAPDWDQIADLSTALSQTNGVVSTSYFSGLASLILAEAADGSVTQIKKGDK